MRGGVKPGRKGALQGQRWRLGGRKGRENRGRRCGANGEVTSVSGRELETKS